MSQSTLATLIAIAKGVGLLLEQGEADPTETASREERRHRIANLQAEIGVLAALSADWIEGQVE